MEAKESKLDEFLNQLLIRAATIDERLSSDFISWAGQAVDIDMGSRRLAAWCRSSANSNWSFFTKRLERDQLSITDVLTQLSTDYRRSDAQIPLWAIDAL